MKTLPTLILGIALAAPLVGRGQALKHLFQEPPPRLLDIAYYPSLDRLNVRVNAAGLAGPVPTGMLRTPDGQPGLRGEYFANKRFAGEPALVRVDEQIDFDWGLLAPADGVPVDHYAVRWSGTIGPFQEGQQLQVAADDGVRVWLDDELVVDDWRDQPLKVNRVAKPLIAGRTYRLRLEYYENNYVAICRLELLQTAPAQAATIELRPATGPALWQQRLTWRGERGEASYPTGRLAAGRYVVRAVLEAAAGPVTVERSFTRQDFPWVGNTLGITNAVFAPFTPLRVTSNTVDVVLRRYQVGGLGLWDSVQAAGNVSAGELRELLAGPMTLRVNAGETLTGSGRFTIVADHAVVYEGAGTHPSVTVRTRATTEYDGCLKMELTLAPSAARQPLEALWLEIPLRAAEAPLFHASTTHLRHNPAGAIPPGKGRVWGSDANPCRWYRWLSTFNAYVWLGAEERGLAWFADNDKNWQLDLKNNPPCQEIIRDGDQVILRVNLVQQPVMLTEPRTIVFGLMASPAKPLRPDWRTVRIAWMGAQYWGSDADFAARYPRHGDLAPLAMVRTLRLGEPFDRDAFLDTYRANHFKPDQPYQRDWNTLRNLLNWTVNWARQAGTNTPTNAYWEEFYTVNRLHSEVGVYQWEWGGDYQWRGWGNIGGVVASYRDFAVWWAEKFIRHGIGLYFDNAFPKANYDPLTSAAYRLPDGRVQPSASIWAHREYLRRIWVLHRVAADPRLPVIQMVHMTNTQILPYLVWNEANLDLEWKDGEEPAQWKYPADLLRAESLGRQSGNIPLALANIQKQHVTSPAREEFAKRTRAAVFAVHEIGEATNERHPLLVQFGYGREDCRVFNYWDEPYPVQFSDPAVKSILLQRNGAVLVALATWNADPAEVTVAVDWRALGLEPARLVARNLETGEVLPIQRGQLQLVLPGYEARYLWIGPPDVPVNP